MATSRYHLVPQLCDLARKAGWVPTGAETQDGRIILTLETEAEEPLPVPDRNNTGRLRQ